MIKGDWNSIVGRRIVAIVVCQRTEHQPRVSIHLVFDDDSEFEVYCQMGDIAGSSYLRRGSLPEVISYFDEGSCLTVLANPAIPGA